MKFNKYMIMGGLVLSLGLSSCVGDLDLNVIDPNYYDSSSPEFMKNALAECYSILAVSGQNGPVSSIISGLDNGRGQYTRALFMMNEFPTDECIWIWKDDGIYDLVTNTFNAENGNIYGTYSRIYAHIGVCNQFLYDTADRDSDPEAAEMRAEARALRALSYYWVLDIWGNGTFVLEPGQKNPPQATRADLYNWLEQELVDIVDNSALSTTPLYGRVGKDGVEALLARLYLNAEVYTNGAVKAWDKCAERCQNIINRHQGGGYQGSGLAEHYLYLFCRNNDEYMPGGSNKAENEILWGIPFDSDRVQSYGGTTFLINGVLADEDGMSGLKYGCSAVWKCMKAPQQFSEEFTNEPNDNRWSLWVKGTISSPNVDGTVTDHEYTITNDEFSEWGSGYVCIKWTGLTHTSNGEFSSDVISTTFGGTDLALIRLSDVYLMYAECSLNGASNADAATAVKYVNYVRQRAGVTPWTTAQLTADNLLDERSRELYWELTRRSDLVRFHRFTGAAQKIWAWKGNVLEGNQIDSRYDLMPIPSQVLSAQPQYVQNPGY